MYNNWNVDLSDSVKALDQIKNTVLPKLISGKIHSIEKSEKDILIKCNTSIDIQNPILKLFDTKSGIDYIRENNDGLQGIASRVQWGKSWESFTIRYARHTGTETEFEKRKRQIKDGYLYPAFTLQAYFDNRADNNLLSIAVIKTIDLYKFTDEYPELVKYRNSDNKFAVIYWRDLKNNCYDLRQINN